MLVSKLNMTSTVTDTCHTHALYVQIMTWCRFYSIICLIFFFLFSYFCIIITLFDLSSLSFVSNTHNTQNKRRVSSSSKSSILFLLLSCIIKIYKIFRDSEEMDDVHYWLLHHISRILCFVVCYYCYKNKIMMWILYLVKCVSRINK